MQHRVEHELAEADAALFVVNGEQGVGGAGRPLHRRGARPRRRPGRDRGQQGRPARPRAHGRSALQAAADLGLRRRGLPDLRPHRHGRRAPLVEHLAGAAARGPVLLPARGGLRPARARACWPSSCASRCCAAPARRSRTRSRSRSRRSSERDDLVDGARAAVGRDRVPEGHPDRRARADDQGDRHRGAARARARARQRTCTSTCRCACAARWRADDALLDRLGINVDPAERSSPQ